MSFEATSISFVGPDGSGKSTIASQLAEHITALGGRVELISSSVYQQWITPAIARDYWSSDPYIFGNEPQSAAEATELYEAVAIVTYGYMRRRQDAGHTLVLDSDPYMKRLIRAHLELPPEEVEPYCTAFEDRVRDSIGTIFPDHLVKISTASPDSTADERDLLGRLRQQAHVSKYDPVTIDQTIRLVAATESVWGRVLEHEHFKRGKSKIHFVENALQNQEDIGSSAELTAAQLISRILQRETS